MPKKINLTQGDPEWLSWRRCHLCGTDTAKIMGKSRWGNAYDVYQSKIEGIEAKVNSAMERGKLLEAEARSKLEELHNITLYPACYESTEYPFMGASLDAVNKKETQGYEIKCTNKKSIEDAKKGIIEEQYIIQCHKQMLVMEWEYIDIFYYDNPYEFAMQVINRDEKLIKEIIKAETDFWNNHIIPKIPPKTDYETITDAYANKIALDYKECKLKAEEINNQLEIYENRLKELSQGKDTIFQDAEIKIKWCQRKGNIDWKKVQKLIVIPEEIKEKCVGESINYAKIIS